VIALAFYFIVVFHSEELSELQRYDSLAECRAHQGATEEAMREIWGVSQCFALQPPRSTTQE
jgi:hypothetical protein